MNHYDLRSDNPINQHDEPREQTQVEYLQEMLNRAENLLDDYTQTKDYLRGKLARVALIMDQHTQHGSLSPEEWIELKELTAQYLPF